jgi:hypothetical protein
MKVDETIARILLTIQTELAAKYKVSLSIEQIHKIVCVQLEATKLGFKQGLTVHWSRLGKFVFTNRKKMVAEAAALETKLTFNEILLPHEKVEIRKEQIIGFSTEKKAHLKQSKLKLTKSISAEKLLGKYTPPTARPDLPVFSLISKPKVQ